MDFVISTYIMSIVYAYFVTVTVSFVIILSLCLLIRFNKRIQKYTTDKFGLENFFRGGNRAFKIWLIILVPVLNIIVSLFCILSVLTDWGDL